MKRCPQCNRTYTDDALSFCLDDGSPLVSTAAPSSFDPSATVQYPQSRETTPQPTIAYPSQQPAMPPPQAPAAPPAWSPMPPVQPQKRSVWPWLLGIGAVLVFMGIGVVILIVAVKSMTNANNNNGNSNSNRTANRNTNTNTNKNANSDVTNTNENSNARSTLTSFSDDFSKEDWRTGSSTYGKMWYADEEYHMKGVKGFYFVIYAPDKPDYKTKNATVRIGTRSIDGVSPTTGYGLVVHGEMKNDQLEDYAFLIYSGDDPKYKIVDQRGGKDTTLVEWTSFSAIRGGTSPNQLEVRIRDRKLDFYINGQFVTSIVDTENFQTGRVGLYASDEHEIAFDDLEISR
jgi:hypothetical protein